MIILYQQGRRNSIPLLELKPFFNFPNSQPLLCLQLSGASGPLGRGVTPPLKLKPLASVFKAVKKILRGADIITDILFHYSSLAYGTRNYLHFVCLYHSSMHDTLFSHPLANNLRTTNTTIITGLSATSPLTRLDCNFSFARCERITRLLMIHVVRHRAFVKSTPVIIPCHDLR